jgi:plasmid stabilization system protein ParE
MTYKVKLTAPAEDDAYAAFERIREVSPDAARRWLIGLFQAIFSLDEMPRRCPMIPEADEIGREIRHLLYGKRTATYRVIFDIDEESEEGPCVRVLRIWRGSRDRIRSEDLEME